MKLVDVKYLMSRDNPKLNEGDTCYAIGCLYQLLWERPPEHGISHKEMPSFAAHTKFVFDHPFRHWYLIDMAPNPEAMWPDRNFVGAIECLPTNEFGIHLLKEFQGRGWGRKAVELFLSTHEPLPAIPAVRNGHWLANVAPANDRAKKFFEGLGFVPIQITHELRR